MCDHLRDIITTKRVAKLVYNEKPAIDDNMPFNNKNCVAIYVLIIGLLITLAVILYYKNVITGLLSAVIVPFTCRENKKPKTTETLYGD